MKLWGNCTFNPISALTHATLVDLCQFPPTRALAERMMREAQEIGEKLGVRFPVSLEKRIAGAEAVGKHKTSMLQDVETGRPLELDALVGSVLELGRLTGVPTPNLTAVHACAALLAKTLRLRWAAAHGASRLGSGSARHRRRARDVHRGKDVGVRGVGTGPRGHRDRPRVLGRAGAGAGLEPPPRAGCHSGRSLP